MKRLSRFYFLLFLIPISFFGQKIDNLASFHDVNGDNYFRWHYDNDYFTAEDRYYTQGYNFELVSPRLKKNPINYLLVKPTDSEKRYGLSFEHLGFTPTSIKSDGILYGDRPFAATAMLRSFIISTDTVSKSRMSSSFSIGVIGKWAFGKEMQTDIHKWIGDETPHDWDNQIQNNLVLNYELAYE